MDRPTLHVYEDNAGKWRWRLRASNNHILAVSSEGYRDQRGAMTAFSLTRDLAGRVDLADVVHSSGAPVGLDLESVE